MKVGPDKAALERLLDDAETKVWSKRPDGRRFLGVRCAPVWSGPAVLVSGDRPFRVETCVSNLEMREKLEQLEAEGADAVLLCPRDERDLGDDVLGRLAKNRLWPVDSATTLLGLFGARDLDPRLHRRPRLLEALVTHAPAGGYPAVGAGILSLEHAVEALLTDVLRFDTGASGVRGLLLWCDGRDGPAAFLRLGLEVRAELRSVLAESNRLGALATEVLDLVEKGRADAVLPLGLALTALKSGADAGDRARRDARIRLEAQAGLADLHEDVVKSWADAAEEVLGALERRDGAAACRSALDKAEDLLRTARGLECSAASRVLDAGRRARLAALGSAISAHLDAGGSAAAVEKAAAGALEHRAVLADRRASRCIEAARRLARWLTTEEIDAVDLRDQTLRYLDDVAWADRERIALGFRLGVDAFDDAARTLATRVASRRAAGNRRFGAEVARTGVDRVRAGTVVGIEDVLQDVVLRAGDGKAPVLLLVFDGMSAAVFQGLIADAAERGWFAIAPEDGAFPRAALAAMPTVTEVSRASLFAGAIRRGDASAEAKAFGEHPALIARSAAKKPPRLFHKADVGVGGSLDSELVQALGDEKQAFVAVVLNAVDDALGKTEQLDLEYGVDLIKPLAPILDVCRSAGRRIVVAADHGHVVEAGTELRTYAGGGLRWRRAAAADEGEVALSGPRVVGHDVVAPWTETLRYGPKQAGYHGGVAPQEVVVPLCCLATEEPAGWKRVAVPPPSWWTGVVPAEPAPATAARPATRKAGELPFDGDGPDPWVDVLLGSELFRSQRRAVARFALKDGAIRDVLRPLGERGGKTTLKALAAGLDLHETRVLGMIEALRRVLNVDGYQVLQVNSASGDVELNLSLLKEQFGA